MPPRAFTIGGQVRYPLPLDAGILNGDSAPDAADTTDVEG